MTSLVPYTRKPAISNCRDGHNGFTYCKTIDGNCHVLVFQDYLTKWPLVYFIPNQKRIKIAQTLVKEVIPFFGVPQALSSDRGTNLLSHSMRDICDLLGI